jgi:hypothetical protein
MRPRTERDNAETQRRKDSNINQCISTESTLEGLICPVLKIFPVSGNASDDHHSLVLLIGGPLVAARERQ